MQTVFWFFSGILMYIFAGYPVLVFFISKIVKRPAKEQSDMQDFPTVTMIIAAYNESVIIKEKIFNTFELDYPKNKLQVIIFSDASTDHTDAIVKSFAPRGIELVRIEGRVGKTECQNQSIKQATGDIVIFSDANSMYDSQAVKNLVRNFANEKIGCVVGELRYVKNEKSNEGLYWKLEQFLKKTESAVDSCLGANGSIYAIRKNLYVPLPRDVISDFIEPFKIYEQGFRVIYEPDAFCSEAVGENKSEFVRKRRIVARTFSSLKHIKSFLNPFKYGWYSITLWSHKVLRWFALIVMTGLLITNVFLLRDIFFLILFIIQIIFYMSTFVGIKIHKKPFSISYLFMVMHTSALLGIFDTLKGKQIVTWSPNR